MTIINLKDILFKVKNRKILSIDEFSVKEGDVLGIMGPNGAGKSTLVKIMALLEEPTSGSYHLNGKKIDFSKVTVEERRQFSIALQQSLLLDTSVYQNVATGLKLRKVDKRIIDERVNYWLDLFQISHLAKKHSANLSGGEAQRVNLARAMVLNPEVVFLDEPFSALDFPTKLQLLDDLLEIIDKEKMTTVFVSHDLMEIRYLTQQLLIIMDGKVAQYGKTATVIDNPNETTKAFIDKWKTLADQ